MAERLDLEDVRVAYGRREVVRSVSIPGIAAGSLVALVGPNAAGKSTMLRALAGLLPASGTVRLDGTDLSKLSVRQRAAKVSFMPQALPDGVSLTVLESVLAALKANPDEVTGNRSERETRALAFRTLARFGIEPLALRPLDHLSGGQRQLASLASATVREPELLLLDEPTSALDLRHQIRVLNAVRSIARSGRIVVAVLHDLTLAAQFADRLVVLSGGKVAADGVPEAAITPDLLRDVYAVEARVERCSLGRLVIAVDGECDDAVAAADRGPEATASALQGMS